MLPISIFPELLQIEVTGMASGESDSGRIFQVGEFTVDPIGGEIVGPAGRERLDPKVMDVLLVLAARAGQVVSRDELMASVWPGVVVGDDALSRCIYQLRRHLSRAGGGERGRALLETLPKRGYRFAGTPQPLASADTAVPVGTAKSAPADDPAGGEVWPGLVVGPETVAKRVQLLRDALDDHGEKPRYLSAVRGRGYRIVAPVTPLADAAEPAEAPPTAPAASLRWRLAAGAAAAAAMIAGAFWFFDPVPPPQPPAAAAPSLPARTIAVLPFLDLSADPNRDYIATGIAEAVLHQLASLREMTVIARTSSSAFKGQDMDVREIGRLLNARYLLEGSVQSAEDRLRVTAQLVDATTGGHLWSLTFDRQPDDIFAVQDEIALKLAESFELSLDAGARNRLSDAPPALEAYQHYLIGREIMYQREPDFPKLATEQFERAIAIDSQYADAHAELGIVLAFMTGLRPIWPTARRKPSTAPWP